PALSRASRPPAHARPCACRPSSPVSPWSLPEYYRCRTGGGREIGHSRPRYRASVPELDHLVLASPDPLATRDLIVARTGVVPSAGGPHVGRGTRNWLAALGPHHYLELIGPDPEQSAPSGPRGFGLDDLTDAALV